MEEDQINKENIAELERILEKLKVEDFIFFGQTVPSGPGKHGSTLMFSHGDPTEIALAIVKSTSDPKIRAILEAAMATAAENADDIKKLKPHRQNADFGFPDITDFDL